METKVISPKLLLFKEGKTTLKNIFAYSDSAVKALMKEVTKAGIEPVGPLEFVYYGITDDLDKEFILQIGIPVKEKKAVGESVYYKETLPFKCISYLYKGDVTKISNSYSYLYKEIKIKQLQPKDEVREVYLKWEHLSSANNITEIQIGIL